MYLLFLFPFKRRKKIGAFRRRNAQKGRAFLAPHLSVSAGFGTLQCRLPWFHRAVPSATLDKGFCNYRFYFIRSCRFVKSILIPSSGISAPFFHRSKFIHDFFHQSGYNALYDIIRQSLEVLILRKLSDAIDRFCLNHPRFGIPGLMR